MDSPRSISSNTYCTDHEGDENLKCYALNDCKTDLKLSENESEVEFVRSIAMSKNIAYSVQDDVDHVIRINTLDRESSEQVCNTNESENFNMDKTKNLDLDHICDTFEPPLAIPLNLKSLCSFILPPADEGIISAVVLSKWDDIMGPQTMYAWLCSNSKLEDEQALKCDSKSLSCNRNVLNHFVTTNNTVRGELNCDIFQIFSRDRPNEHLTCSSVACLEKCIHFLKAIKYVTCHTVNCRGVILVRSEQDTATEGSLDLFIVPELDLLAQCLTFQLQATHSNGPYSLAIMVSYQYYNCFLQLRHMCGQWLWRMASLLCKLLLQSAEFESSEQVDSFVLDLCTMLMSVKNVGIISRAPSYCPQLFQHPVLLHDALTSHLQTAGCTLVMGTSFHDVNMGSGSLLVYSTGSCRCKLKLLTTNLTCKMSTHLLEICLVFLDTTGILMNEYGSQQWYFPELKKNWRPLTIIDLAGESDVKQILLHNTWHFAELQNANNHLKHIGQNSGSASLVSYLLADLKQLPPSCWKTLVRLFKRKLELLVSMLFTLISTKRDINPGASSNLQKYISEAMNLNEADIFIVLAAAEKVKPGTYSYVIEGASSWR